MIIIDMVRPTFNENVTNAFYKLIGPVTNPGSTVEYHTNIKKFLKSKFNYDTEFIFSGEYRTLTEIRINTNSDEVWFVLKHG